MESRSRARTVAKLDVGPQIPLICNRVGPPVRIRVLALLKTNKLRTERRIYGKSLLAACLPFWGHELSENFRVASYFKIKTYLTSRRGLFIFLAAAKERGGAENDPKRYTTFEPAPRLNK